MAMASVDDVLKSALGLPVEERAVLAERLLASLDDLDEREWDRLWGEEAAGRVASYRSGVAQVRAAEDVYEGAERLLSD